MAKPRGRKRTVAGLSENTAKNLPKIETDEMRQARSFYLSLPQKERTFTAVAKEFECDHDKIWRWARAFNWIEDAALRDAAITDPFVEQNQKAIEGARSEAFRYLCAALRLEIKRQALELDDEDIIAKLKTGDLDEAVKGWTSKDWMAFMSKLPMKAKDYKDFIQIIDGIRKVVFEWNPNQVPKSSLPGGGKFELNNCNLIIERGGPDGSTLRALAMTGSKSVKPEDKGQSVDGPGGAISS